MGYNAMVIQDQLLHDLVTSVCPFGASMERERDSGLNKLHVTVILPNHLCYDEMLTNSAVIIVNYCKLYNSKDFSMQNICKRMI